MSVCCRVMVRDRYGVWSAVTENISTRGCRIATPRLLRPGTSLQMTFSSDLFADELEMKGEAAWSTGERLGVIFTQAAGGARSLAAWLDKVLELGAMPDSATTFRVAPSVSRVAAIPMALTPPPAAVAPIGFVSPPVSEARAAVASARVGAGAPGRHVVVRPASVVRVATQGARVAASPQNAIRITARPPR